MSVSRRVAIVDGGGANIASLKFALGRLDCDAELTTDPAVIRAAPRVILPGVGAARAAMERLQEHGLTELLPQLTQPVLGICLGMQLLFDASEEDDAQCLGIIAGTARRLEPVPDRPVPHMGWNQLTVSRQTPLLSDVPIGSYCYFVHSYALPELSNTLATTDYGVRFSSVVQHRNFLGTQFHPERSGTAGARILSNFINLC